MNQLKIAHIATIDLSLRYLLLNQLQALQQAGYEVVGMSASGPDVDALEASGIRHFAVPLTRNLTPRTDLIALWQLVRILRRERPTIVHTHTPKAELLGQVAARLAGVPIVVDTFRGIYYRSDMHPFWQQLFIMMARIAAGQADVVLSQSREAMQMAIETGICPPEKIKWLGNGIDVIRFSPELISATQLTPLRQSLGLALEAKVIGFVGRLVQEKGLLELLQAAQQVYLQHPQAQFLIIGPVDHDKPDALTPAIVADYGLNDCCIFTGFRNDLPELYALMDIFVLPSHRESFPRAPMEAAAMQVPCIVSDIPGCRETVDHEQNGLFVPLGDVSALAEAILRLLTNQDEARQMGERGRQIALERFDERLVFEKVKATYIELLSQKGL